ncbi:hypothetical protein HELRODRAFT_106865 [Helobdella robusta]|uniref:Receptor expression-enhancing protein n=1 Tax=Helobdella robusta TaxID=6412 RepID=T1EE53_HELRO|nr:hypothetical protein HELRODRAFT_106865 [Helobdella robusta]ESO02724.1 hypothetical protein HELRODRAFT_106865 [Helobdella robusta]
MKPQQQDIIIVIIIIIFTLIRMTSGWSRVRERWDKMMQQLDEKLHQKNSFNDQLTKIEEKTHIPRLRFVQATLLMIFVLVTFCMGSEIISHCVGFLYPAYASIKAIESLNKDDDTRWLTYWVVYGFFVFSESLTDIFLFWFPFYWTTKCIFLIWCMLPIRSNGSDFIYNFLIRPLFLKHEKQIDDAINQAQSNAKQYIGKGFKSINHSFIHHLSSW